MKKMTLFASAFFLLLGVANVASATVTFTNAATTVLGGILFAPSTNVGVAAAANATNWAAQAKHVQGGTSQYGMLNTNQVMVVHKNEAAADPVDAPTNETTLSITAN
jgi:hypothetical protein